MTDCRWSEDLQGEAANTSVRDFIRSQAADSRLFVNALREEFSDRELLRQVGTLESLYPVLRSACERGTAE